jgi:hypothetical protein
MNQTNRRIGSVQPGLVITWTPTTYQKTTYSAEFSSRFFQGAVWPFSKLAASGASVDQWKIW